MNISTVQFVCFAGLIYLVYCCTTQKPERTLYGFTCIWLFFPKSLQQLPLLGPLNWEGHAIFEFVEAFLAAGVAGALLARRAKRAESWPPNRSEGRQHGEVSEKSAARAAFAVAGF